MGSLGVESASPGATDAAGNSITHTGSGAGSVLAVEDLPVPSVIGAPLTLRGREGEGDESILSAAEKHAIVT